MEQSDFDYALSLHYMMNGVSEIGDIVTNSERESPDPAGSDTESEEEIEEIEVNKLNFLFESALILLFKLDKEKQDQRSGVFCASSQDLYGFRGVFRLD